MQEITQDLNKGAEGFLFDTINTVCEDFTREWRGVTSGDGAQDLANRLKLIGEDARPTLLRNLMRIEIERRRRIGERPHVEEYLSRLGEFASIIRREFLLAADADAIETNPPEAGDRSAPAARRLGEYRLIREVGRGGMGIVFEAAHLVHHNRVALKTLPTGSEDYANRLHMFRREFRTLADVNHPNLVGLQTLEADGPQWFFTMDFIEGTDFQSFVRPGGALDESRLRLGLRGLVAGVMALHARHIVHRDLKPSNVLVKPDGGVVLLDFGLAVQLRRADDQSPNQVAGTPGYMAPEQIALAPLTGATDWYAVGAMLYEALTGALPFSGSVFHIMREKQFRDPPPIAKREGVPEALADLSMRLLAREPRDRPNALEIAQCISSELDAYPLESSRGRLVGRDSQRRALETSFQDFLKSGEPIAVFISGRSGEGKSSLAGEFIESLDPAITVMSGRCYDRESVPFKALDGLIDAICNHLRALPDAEATAMLPADVGMLAELFPLMNRVRAASTAPSFRGANLSDEQVRARAFVALRELLRHIGARAPIVWFVDDLQWGDSDSAEVAIDVLRPPDPPRILMIGAFRSDEADDSPFLASWERRMRRVGVEIERRDVSVGPLDESACLELVVNELGRDDPVVRRRAAEFARETGGNPYLLIELIGCFDPESDSFETLRMDEVLDRKLARLPIEAGGLLEIVAISGQSISLEEASVAAGMDLTPISAVSRTRSERLLRTVGSEEFPRIDTYHDRIRETILAGMPVERNRALHLGLASCIESRMGYRAEECVSYLETARPDATRTPALDRVYDLAYHFDAAGDSRNAWIYALLAAEQAGRRRATEVAAEQFAIAARNVGLDASPATRFRIDVGFGEALLLLGRYKEAKLRLERAGEIAANLLDRSRVALLLAKLALRRSDIDESVNVSARALRGLGKRVPRTDLGFAAGAIKEILIQIVHTYFPKSFVRSDRTLCERSELIVELLSAITHALWYQSSIRLLWANLTAMNAAERFAPTPALASIYNVHTITVAAAGMHKRGHEYQARARALSPRWDDRLGVGSTDFFRGLALYAGGRYREAIDVLSKAVEILEGTGDQLYLNIGRYHIGLSHGMLGDLRQAIDVHRRTFHIGVRLEDDSLSHYTIDGWAKASRGRLPFELLKSCFKAIPSDIQSTNQLLQAEGQWRLFLGRPEQAARAFEQAFALSKKHVLYNWLTIAAVPGLATALRLRADELQATDARAASATRGRAYRIIRRASRVFRFFPTEYAYVLREHALLLSLRGANRKALCVVEQSRLEAEKRGESYQLAESSLVRGRLRRELKLPGADEEIIQAELALENFQARIASAEPERVSS